ncbi:MAG TPA: hypothetical protein ENH60_09150, partial [Pricia sp.]|nr:hypothetical protein [Pricia sp.]
MFYANCYGRLNMTKAEILQTIQAEFGDNVTVEFQGDQVIITFPDGTVKTINITPGTFDTDPLPMGVDDQAQGTGATHYSDDMGDVIE